MSIPESMKQITEAAEKLIAPDDIQTFRILSEEQLKKQGQRIIFQNDAPDKTELVLGDEFEVKVENGKTFVVRKQSSYPKTFENCLKILGYNIAHTIPTAREVYTIDDHYLFEDWNWKQFLREMVDYDYYKESEE